MNFITRTLLPLRSHLVSDPSKTSLQGLIENAIRRTRIFFRVLYKEGNGSTSGFRQQHRFSETVESYGSKLRGVTKQIKFLRPGYIYKATSKWSSSSLAAVASKDARKRIFRGGSGPLLAFVGFTLAKKPSLLTEQEEPEGLTYEIRDSFSKLPQNVIHKHNTEHLLAKPETTLNDLQIGNLLAKGCNAAVYSACWKYESSGVKNERSVQTLGKMIISHSESEISTIADCTKDPASENDGKKHTSIAVSALAPYDLAVKLMFNYNAESNAYAIWKAMYKESLPAILNFPINEAMGLKRREEQNKLPPHPNIVEMYCAFADQVPLLPEAFASYPQALPLRLTNEGCGRNMTLFLVMKRYHCCLKDYLKMYQPSTKTSLLLLCQLLEGLVHLQQHEVVHRDLKTDNILIDLTYGVSNPGVAITDFGCCLESFQLAYRTEELDKGGNMALMAPEVATATVGPFTTIDYSRSDLWTVGTMAYEIFGTANPFYLSTNSFLQTSTYDEKTLPALPSDTPAVIKKLIKDMLNRDPDMRPSPTLAATVCQLLLHAPPELLVKPCQKNYKEVVDWLFMMAAQTFLQAVVQHSRSSSIEFQLRYSFCSRIQFCELLQALKYISQA